MAAGTETVQIILIFVLAEIEVLTPMAAQNGGSGGYESCAGPLAVQAA